MQSADRSDLDAHWSQAKPSEGQPDPNGSFYLEYRRVFSSGVGLSFQLSALRQHFQQLHSSLLDYQKRAEVGFRDRMRRTPADGRKRARRGAGQIERGFVCGVEGCGRRYATMGSLAQHGRIKHGESGEGESQGEGEAGVGKAE